MSTGNGRRKRGPFRVPAPLTVRGPWPRPSKAEKALRRLKPNQATAQQRDQDATTTPHWVPVGSERVEGNRETP